MIKKIFKTSIRNKLILVSLLLLIIPTLSVGLISYSISKDELNTNGEIILKNGVKQGMDMLEFAQDQVNKGHMDLEEAQDLVKSYLVGEKNSDGTRTINKHVDLGLNGYFWIMDGEGKILAHPTLDRVDL